MNLKDFFIDIIVIAIAILLSKILMIGIINL